MSNDQARGRACASDTIAAVLFCVLFAVIVVAASPAMAQEENEMADWYPWQVGDVTSPSVIGMADWLEKPAGARGPVQMDGDRLVLGDGTPIKFWGVNLGNAHCAPPKADGERWIARNAKFGVNAVRLHKFIGDITVKESSTRFDPEMLDRLDYFTDAMARNGMYYGFSWIFGHPVRPEDADKLQAYDEIVAAGGETSRVLVFIAEDVQDLRIEMLVNLLKHRNAYTDMTYAEDPALAFVEFQNEDSIFFSTFRGFNDLENAPTYKRAFLQKFSNWLQDKYGSHEGLVTAWGERAMNVYEIKDERLDAGNIMVQGNPWFFSPEGMAQAEQQGTTQRLLDTAAFLHEVQMAFYRKFEKAVRDAGYDGPLVASCWTTPAGLPMYYNLHTDAEIGIVDRHNYFGGLSGYRPRPDRFDAGTQLAAPGTGLLSKGLLQVIDRPYAFSEWNTVFPNQYAAESMAIIAAYGMGLQGWDASYHFASHVQHGGGFATRVDGPRLWNLDVPNQIGLYPVLARMIYRGDVEEGEPIGIRRVSVDDLAEGGPDWIDAEASSVSEGLGDMKQVRSNVPPHALARGRMVVEFVEEPSESVFPDLDPLTPGEPIVSTTEQLQWTVLDDDKGWLSIDTPGTQAFVGFKPEQPRVELGEVTFAPQDSFSSLFVTAIGRNEAIADADEVLLVAMARVRNEGMRISESGDKLLALGGPPIMIEPVAAEIEFTGREVEFVELLDHDGRPTGQTLTVEGGRFAIDGARDRTLYYRVRFK